MKTLDQLGISPAPWYIEGNTGVLCAKSEHYKHPIVDDCGNFENNNDKRLIAAAPKLYEALREAIEYTCKDCVYHIATFDDDKLKDEECILREPCKAHEWRAALADASEEVVK